ncbi:MAG: hypothetical protein ACI9Z9_001883, partial [Litorivivens sp.]
AVKPDSVIVIGAACALTASVRAANPSKARGIDFIVFNIISILLVPSSTAALIMPAYVTSCFSGAMFNSFTTTNEKC